MKKFANVALLVAMVIAPAQAGFDSGQDDRVASTAQVEVVPVSYSIMTTATAIGSVPNK